MNKLSKSVARYGRMKFDPKQPTSEPYREAKRYYEELCREFGRDVVRAEYARQWK